MDLDMTSTLNSVGRVYVGRNWVILKCKHSLGQYIRKLYSMQYHGCRKLERPCKDEHITILSPHENIGTEKFKKFDYLNLSFKLDINPYHNGNAVWYPASSVGIECMRKACGLLPFREIPLHFCVGYFHDPEFLEISQDFS